MRKLVLLLVLYAIVPGSATAQNPQSVFTFPSDTIRLGCGINCTNITATVPHIKQSTNYVVTNPTYLPYAYLTSGGNQEMILYDDDQWSEKIAFPIGFFFCYYGITYPKLLMGSNSALTFDTTEAGEESGYEIVPGGSIPSTDYAKAMIFGPYHDIDPSESSTNLKLEWRVEGTPPKRRFIASYNDVPYFGSDCENYRATHQIVLYENTGVIEMYIKDKPYCVDWNDGLTILGVQDETRTKAVTAAGKNATVWGKIAMDSCFRFTPSGGAPTFKRAELLVNNTVIATTTTDTASASTPGLLNINFANLCPTADSTAYAMRVVYGSCNNPNIEVSFMDTVYVKKSILAATFAKTDATCSAGGSITVTATGVSGTAQYSKDNGATFQASNIFTNLTAGTYAVLVKDAGTCPVSQQVVVGLNGAVTVNAGLDTTICTGASFSRRAVSTATTYSWQPTTGVSDPSSANPVFSPTATTTYIVTASTGNCTAQDNLMITVAPGASINAGPDAFVLSGQSYTMQASGSAGSYVWTPATGLSSATSLTPTVNLQQTTTYTLAVTTPQGCKASDEVTLTLLPFCMRPMEAFTPNGDGVNDQWLVTTGSCLKTATVQVFNRYGAKVFESKDYKNNWNGEYKGKPLADGTYYFVISFQLVNGETQYLKGNVTILR